MDFRTSINLRNTNFWAGKNQMKILLKKCKIENFVIFNCIIRAFLLCQIKIGEFQTKM